MKATGKVFHPLNSVLPQPELVKLVPVRTGDLQHCKCRYFCRMYSRQESALLIQEFWTVFGQYMSPILSAEGQKINWINYKTGEKDVFFRMQATGKTASIAIEIRHNDPMIRQLYFEQFLTSKSLFNSIMEEEWTWNLQDQDENGRLLSRVYTSIAPVNIFKKDDWHLLISFFKSRMIRLDQFWSEIKYGFELLH